MKSGHAAWRSVVVVGLLVLVGCGRRALEDRAEIAQSAADALASFDEAGQAGGTSGFAQLRAPRSLEHTPIWERALEAVLPAAHAHAGHPCWSEAFSACSNGDRTRNLDGCSVGRSTLTGTVKLTFSDTASCSMVATNASVTRTANFTLTAPRGSLEVTADGGGQKVTRTGAAAFTYSVGGMKRVLKNVGGTTVADVSTKTTADISVTGTNRANRVMNGGTFVITNNLNGYSVSLSPENLTWSSSCSCPVSGKLTGTVSNSADAKTFTLEITGCGTGTVTTDAEKAEEVELDRCSGV